MDGHWQDRSLASASCSTGKLQRLYAHDLGEPKISREDLAGMIIGCHAKGMTAEVIKEFLIVDLSRKS